MTILTKTSFLTDEAGAIIVEWTTMVAAIVGFGIAAVAAVQTGVVSLGGSSSTSLQETTANYSAAIASGGPDVQMNTGGNNVYTPLSTRKDEYAMFMYELSGKSYDELSAIYLQYMAEADRLLALGDKDGAAKHLDVAGAAASVMRDNKYDLPDTDQKLSQYYGQLKTDGDMGTAPNSQRK